MGVIQDAGVEAVLPDPTGGALGSIVVSGVQVAYWPFTSSRSARSHPGNRQPRPGGNGWTSRCKRRPALLGVLLDEVQEVLPIGVGGKDGLFVVAALGEVEPVTRRGEAKAAGHFCSSAI